MASLEEDGNFSRFFLFNSTVAPTCVFFICIIIMIVFSTTKPIAKPRPVVWGTEAIMTLLSMIVTFVIWYLVRRNTRKFLIEKQRRDVTLNIKLVFFWAFGLANVFNSAFNMGSNFDCLLKDGQQPFLYAHYITIVTHLTEIFFCVGQLGFLSLYGKFSFRPSALMNYVISLMIIAHLLRWFRLLFDSIMINTSYSRSNWNETYQNDCYYSSSVTIVLNHMSSYIIPMVTEYSLLSVVIVVRMVVGIFSNESIQRNVGENIQDISDETATNDELVSSEMLTRRLSATASLTCGIIFSLPFCTAFTLTFLDTVNSVDAFRIISTIYELEILALLLFGKWKFKSQFADIFIKDKTFSKYNMTLIFITSGAVAYETFGAIAGLMKAENIFCFLLLFNKILQTSVIIIQTEFILHMKNISFRPKRVQSKYFRANRIFLCIFVINIIRWLVDSIVMGHETDASAIQREFYGNVYWDTIEHTIFPVNVFYRFLTAMEMYELYRNTNTKHSV